MSKDYHYMKNKIFKTIILGFVILLSIAGSFITNASEKKNSQILVSYITPEEKGVVPCSIAVCCQDLVSDVICTGTYQGVNYRAYGKINSTDVTCPMARYYGGCQ